MSAGTGKNFVELQAETLAAIAKLDAKVDRLAEAVGRIERRVEKVAWDQRTGDAA